LALVVGLILDMVWELTEATAYLDQLRQLEEVAEATITVNKLVLLVAQVVAVLIVGVGVAQLLQLKDLQVVTPEAVLGRKHQVVVAVLEQLVEMVLVITVVQAELDYHQV